MTRVAGLIVLCAMVALAASGCGGSSGPHPLSKKDYIAQLNVLSGQVRSFLDGLRTPAPSARVAAARLSSLRDRLEAGAAKLDKIVPPKEIEKQHRALVTGVRDLVDELDPLIARIRRGNLPLIATVTSLPGVSKIQAAVVALAQKGYLIGTA